MRAKRQMKLKKFRNTLELEDAYVALEKDYTKKCQELSKLKKDMAAQGEVKPNEDYCSIEHHTNQPEQDYCSIEYHVDDMNNYNSIEHQCDKKETECGTIEGQDADLDSNCLDDETPNKGLETKELDDGKIEQAPMGEELELGQLQPVFMSPMWQTDAKEFFAGHPAAASFERDILNELLSDRSLACKPDALKLASERVLGRVILQGTLGEALVSVIAQNAEVCAKVVGDYLAKLRSRATPPPRVSARGTMVASPRPKFSSIKEAGNALLGRHHEW